MRVVDRIASYLQFKKPPFPNTPFGILLLSMNFPPEMIGVGKYTGELAQWLARRGHRVDAVVAHPHYPGFAARCARPGRYARTLEADVDVTRCPLILRRGGRGIWRLVAPLSFGLAAAPVAVWRALRSRPAVVLCVEPTLASAPAAMLAARLIGAGLVLHVQDLEVDAAFSTGILRSRALRWAAERLERRLLRAFDGVITISEAMAKRLADKGVAPERLMVLRNWVSAATPAIQPATARARLGIAADERVVLYAGSLGAKQNVPLLLDALRQVSARRPVRVVIAGEGPMAPLVEAARHQLPKLIRLPLQTTERHAELLAMADVHVLPQDARAADLVFPSKLGPMLASGRPIVVTADEGSELARWLGGAALVVPAGDAAGLAAAIATVLDEPAGRRSGAAQMLAATLDARIVLPAFEACLAGVLASKAERRRPLPATWRPAEAGPHRRP